MSILILLISTSTGLSVSKRDQEADEYKEVRVRRSSPDERSKIVQIFLAI